MIGDGMDTEARALSSNDAALAVLQFLQALFAETDLILLRPIESWIEEGRKKSRVLYEQTRYLGCRPDLLQIILPAWIEAVGRERANAFFGVCPRFGNHGRYDLAWQIRTVRCLWSDIDHVTVDAAIERCAAQQLPPPSVAVNSGNGAHLYWILEEPYVIDDVGEPPPVWTDWTDRKKPRRFYCDGKDRIYLDTRHHVSRLSPKGQRVQDILAGIATAVGGDHTTDLARLLRLPGTLNRKDERNRKSPVGTALVVCNSANRYAISDFERFATLAPATQQRRQIELMPLPSVRKLSGKRGDKLAELIALCAVAPQGHRSEADFAVCCYAIRNGIAKNEVWNQVKSIGKFGEQGERYFALTWENAEYDVRVGVHQKLQKRIPQPVEHFSEIESRDGAAEGSCEPPGFPEKTCKDDDRPTIHVESATIPVASTMRQITDRLLQSNEFYNRADQIVGVRNESIVPILSSRELAGILNHYMEFFFADGDEGEFKPIPPNYGNTWLNHPGERARFPKIQLFTHNPVYTVDWQLIGPGYDSASKIYYCGTQIEAREGTECLDALLRDFCFKSPADRTNYLGLLLTVLLVPHFIGSKPAALFNGNQPQLGKSILAQIIAILRDGAPVETATYNPNDEEFEKRLGAIVRRGATTLIVDNAKGRGRSVRIESACLERSITDPILSYRLLGFSKDIRVENSHIFCVTANTPDVSRDLITRSVVINLHYEGNPTKRSFSIADPEGYAQQHRLEILGELIGMVERWKASGRRMANVDSRFNKRGWAQIIGGILEANNEPDFLANAETAATELDETRREFAELVGVLAERDQSVWTAGELAELAQRRCLLQSDLGEASERSRATRMGTLAGRFVAERFEAANGAALVFNRSTGRKGSVYRVEVVDEVPNVEAVAERVPNVGSRQGSAA
jgi:hypothetical protein